ncbi:MAG: pyrroline-5-carboxylate reductase [Hyphomicrobiaceae bacterium]
MTMPLPAWNLDGPILLAGCGKMGGAMLAGWLASGIPPADVLIQEPHPSPDLANFCTEKGVSLAAIQTPARAPAVIIMAVKPQAMAEAFPALAARAAAHTIILSIAAGKTIASFEQHLPANSAVVRAMPNTPAAIGRGMTVLCPNAHVTQEQRALCERLMSAVGETGWVDDESLMDAVTAVSGSGPAYVFLLAEAMTQAGINAGLAPALATQLARATIAGSGELMRQAPEIPASTHRQNVTSPGGTTAAALDVLMANDGLMPLMDRAIAAATARGKALAK